MENNQDGQDPMTAPQYGQEHINNNEVGGTENGAFEKGQNKNMNAFMENQPNGNDLSNNESYIDTYQMERLLTDSDISNIDEYNPYAIPPDLELSRLHEKCNSIGQADDKIQDVCKCCAQIETKPFKLFSMSFNPDMLARYGSGYPLYLRMIMFTIIVLTFPLLFNACFAIYRMSKGTQCVSSEIIDKKITDSMDLFINKWFNNPADLRWAGLSGTRRLDQDYHQRLRKLSSAEKFLNHNQAELSSTPRSLAHNQDLANFDPDIELAKAEEKPLRVFMLLFCKSRFVDIDLDCWNYEHMLCSTVEGFENSRRSGGNKCKKIAFYKNYVQSLRGSCNIVYFPYYTNLSLANIMYKDPTKEPINYWWWHLINYITMFLLWCMVVLWAVYYRHKSKYYNRVTFTPKDYTVMIKGLPRYMEYTENGFYNMREGIRKAIELDGFEVEQVSCVYDTIDYTKKRLELRKLQISMAKELYKYKQDLYKNPKAREKGKNEMQNISRKIQDIEFELDKMEIDFEGKLSIKFTGQAFVSFRYEVQKQAFLKKYKKRGTCWNWFGCCARIDNKIVLSENTMDYKAYAIRAPEPNDVYWDALCYRTRDVRKFTVLSWFLGILLMVFSFSAVVGMYIVASNFQTELVRTNKKYSYLEKLSPIV